MTDWEGGETDGRADETNVDPVLALSAALFNDCRERTTNGAGVMDCRVKRERNGGWGVGERGWPPSPPRGPFGKSLLRFAMKLFMFNVLFSSDTFLVFSLEFVHPALKSSRRVSNMGGADAQ